MFKGDLAQFAPADLLLFLCHMNKEGVLTVRHGAEALNLAFQRNLLVEAHDEASDRLILAQLEHGGAIAPERLQHLRQAQEETGLPMSRVLTEMSSFQAPGVGEALRIGRRETVMRLLLLDSGEFQFSEIPVDPVPLLPPCDGQARHMAHTREAPEHRDSGRGIGDHKPRPVRPAPGRQVGAETGAVATVSAEQLVLLQAETADSAEALLAEVPLPRLVAARAVRSAIDRGWLELTTAAKAGPTAAGCPEPSFFSHYRAALRRLLQAGDQQQRMRELLQFAQMHCKVSALLVLQAGSLRRATVYYRDPGGRIAARDHREPPADLAGDPVFAHVRTSGLPFFGAVFASPLLDALEADAPAVDCAILPLGPLGAHELLLYAATAEPSPCGGPLACLELLSWQLRRPAGEVRPEPAPRPRPGSPAAAQTETSPAASGPAEAPAGASRSLDRMVAAIKDLPPMPQVIARVLSLLGNPDCKLSELSGALSQDPALVARLIKVSNSSLYSGGQACGSLNQAIVRLGTRTTRSVVVAASTRSLFPTDSSRIGLLGRRLWRHAVETGLAARRVAEFLRRCDPDEAFAGGVLHDIGKLIILLNLPDAACAIHGADRSAEPDGVAAEQQRLGFDHTEVGERLLQSWNLPESLAACARWHHRPEAAGVWSDLARVICCGDLLSHRLGAANGGGDHEPAAADSAAAQRLAAATESLGLDENASIDLLGLLALDLQQDDLLD